MRSPESVTIGTGGALAEKNKAVIVTSAPYTCPASRVQ